ncbi:uncharacterized protein RJT21DRAFT_123405 [Scheffersomyces amazonensis]|uniref:uncharacterized protein n=1 Tax=Scheffersomyces amazonensis TaxID=1078765 RepID=UPI00315D80B9
MSVATTYRAYQQVLNISIQPKSIKSVNKKSSGITAKSEPLAVTNNNNNNNTNANIKRRTKTGCLTCRKRKKKCDEDKVNGKCQGCTRNFLECCWPEPTTVTTTKCKVQKENIKVKSLSSPVLKSTKCSISSLLIPDTVKIESVAEVKVEQQVTNPYPSPSQSPLSHGKNDSNDISFIALPPLLSVPYKISNNDSNIRGIKEEEQKVTVPSPGSSARSSIVEATTTVPSAAKFVITSVNAQKDLCQIPSN